SAPQTAGSLGRRRRNTGFHTSPGWKSSEIAAKGQNWQNHCKSSHIDPSPQIPATLQNQAFLRTTPSQVPSLPGENPLHPSTFSRSVRCVEPCCSQNNS